MGARRFGEKYHVTDSYRIATNETGEILNASEVWQLYIDAGSSLTQFISLMGYPATGYGRRIANRVFNQYDLTPKQHHHINLRKISYEDAYQAYSESSSLTEIGKRLGAQSDDRAYQLGRQIVDKWDFDTSALKWRSTSIADSVSEDDAIAMLERSNTLREFGQCIRDKTQSNSDRIYLARKVIALYHLDNTKFQQCPTAGMTRDEVLDAYMASTSQKDFMTRLGYKRTDYFNSVVTRFSLPEKEEWRHHPVTASEKRKIRKEPRPIESYVPTRNRLIQARGHICEICNRSVWQGNKIPLEMHHINGNHQDNRWDNVQLLCCNCHSQISIRQAHSRSGTADNKVSDEILVNALRESETISAALRLVHLSIGKHSYNRCYHLIDTYKIQPYYEYLYEI